jgi:predicted CopG family antitoxin
MVSKNLAVREKVYRRLLEAKKGDESFSDVIERLLEGKRDLMAFAGVFSDDREFEQAAEDMKTVRKKTVLRN